MKIYLLFILCLVCPCFGLHGHLLLEDDGSLHYSSKQLGKDLVIDKKGPRIFSIDGKYMKFTFTINGNLARIFCSEKEATRFSWDNIKALWKATTDGRSWYLHFRNKYLSFASPGKYWFYADGENIVYGDFSSKNRLMSMALGMLRDETTGDYIKLANEGSTITGFSYSKTCSAWVKSDHDGVFIEFIGDGSRVRVTPSIFYRNRPPEPYVQNYRLEISASILVLALCIIIFWARS